MRTAAVRLLAPPQPQRLHAGLPGAVHVGVQAVPHVHGARRGHADGVESVRENAAVRLLPADHGGDADVLHAGHHAQAVQQVQQSDVPVGNNADGVPAPAQGLKHRETFRVKPPDGRLRKEPIQLVKERLEILGQGDLRKGGMHQGMPKTTPIGFADAVTRRPVAAWASAHAWRKAA